VKAHLPTYQVTEDMVQIPSDSDKAHLPTYQVTEDMAEILPAAIIVFSGWQGRVGITWTDERRREGTYKLKGQCLKKCIYRFSSANKNEYE
jgi:hypothetical protein